MAMSKARVNAKAKAKNNIKINAKTNSKPKAKLRRLRLWECPHVDDAYGREQPAEVKVDDADS